MKGSGVCAIGSPTTSIAWAANLRQKATSSMSSTVLELPNPYTPLAFLPPDLANKTEATCYVYVAALSAFIWDWLTSMAAEYRIARSSRGFSLPIFAYFLSRIGTLGYCATATAFQVGLAANCQVLLYIVGVFSILALPATSMLFFVRVRAVYENSAAITYFFACIWLTLVGAAIIVPFTIFGGHLGTTQRCIMTGVRSYASTVVVINTANDTLVFIAISFRIITYGVVGDTWHAKCKSFFHGDNLQKLSKHIRQSGQLYYFATIGLSIAACTMVMTPGIPTAFRCILAIPDIALQNSMACRVFRDVKLSYINDAQAFTISTINFRSKTYPSGNQIAMEHIPFDRSRNLQRSTDIVRMADFAENARDSHEYEKEVPIRIENGDRLHV